MTSAAQGAAPAAVGTVLVIKNSKDDVNKSTQSAHVKVQRQYIVSPPAGEVSQASQQGLAFDDDEKERSGYRREAPASGCGGRNASETGTDRDATNAGTAPAAKVDPRDARDAIAGITRENRGQLQPSQGERGKGSAGVKVCFAFQKKGHCNLGDMCRFSHAGADAEPPVGAKRPLQETAVAEEEAGPGPVSKRQLKIMKQELRPERASRLCLCTQEGVACTYGATCPFSHDVMVRDV